MCNFATRRQICWVLSNSMTKPGNGISNSPMNCSEIINHKLLIQNAWTRSPRNGGDGCRVWRDIVATISKNKFSMPFRTNVVRHFIAVTQPCGGTSYFNYRGRIVSRTTHRFHRFWHLDHCSESNDDNDLFHLFHGHVFALHPALGPFCGPRQAHF